MANTARSVTLTHRLDELPLRRLEQQTADQTCAVTLQGSEHEGYQLLLDIPDSISIPAGCEHVEIPLTTLPSSGATMDEFAAFCYDQYRDETGQPQQSVQVRFQCARLYATRGAFEEWLTEQGNPHGFDIHLGLDVEVTSANTSTGAT